MSLECTHNCNSCGRNCSERTNGENTNHENVENPFAVYNNVSDIKKVIAVVSGKGGVGKSMVTSLMSVLARRKGYNTAILDADITGPSIPKTFKISEKAVARDEMLVPIESGTGIKLMSINFLLDDETKPVIWRGPVIAGTVKQFYSEVIWGDVDYMFVDCPPGTGDVPLTVFQSLPVDGIIVVTSPQELVASIVEKAVNMADMMNVPIFGIVENMSYFICDKCKEKHFIYGESDVDEIAKKHGIKNVAKMPMDKELRRLVDSGNIEKFEGDWLNDLMEVIDGYK